MRRITESGQKYFEKLQKRAKKSRVHNIYQSLGIEIAQVLGDLKHKSLYIKLAKIKNGEKLLALAKTIAENPDIKNRGAYFMKMLKTYGYFNDSK